MKVKLGGYARRREELLIRHLARNLNKPTYSENLREIPEIIELCHGNEVIFDFIRVTILDLQEQGLIECERYGWNLTELGYEVCQSLFGEDDIPF